MADVAISYAHSDAELARTLAAALGRRGASVWIDAPDETDEAVGEAGIPVGQSHWSVIEAEFAVASVIAVLDTPEWHASEYCQREYGLCTELGKAVRYVAADGIERAADDILATLAAHGDALSAHARLASRVLGAKEQPSAVQKVISHLTAGDADVVLAAPDSPAAVTPVVRGVIERELAFTRDARRTLRRSSRGALAFLGVAAVIAVVLWGLAARFSAEANASEASARAQALANDARLATDTVVAVAIAAEAVELDPTSANEAALMAALTRDARLRSIDLPTDTYLGAAWAGEEPIVLVYTMDAITTVHTTTGEVGARVAVELPIRPGTLQSGPDGTSAVYITHDGDLAWIDLATGRNPIAMQGPVSALALTEAGEVVWASSGDLAIRIAAYPEGGTVPPVHSVSVLPSIVRAVDVDGDAVAALGDDGVVRLLRVGGGTLTIESEARVSDRSGSSSGGYRNTVTICGDQVAGAYSPNTIRGTAFEWTPGAAGGPQTQPASRISGPVCTPVGALTAGITAGALSTFDGARSISDAPDLYWRIAARDPRHARVAYVSPTPSRLIVGHAAALPMETKIGPAATVIPLDERTLYIDDTNTMRDVDTKEPLGALGDVYPALQTTSILGCDALVGALDGIFHVGCEGGVTRVVDAEELSSEAGKFLGLRAGGDGEHFVLTQNASVTLLDRDGSVDSVTEVLGLRGDALAEADISADGSTVWIITVMGDVYRVDRSSGQLAPNQEPMVTVTAGNSNMVAALADGDVVVSSSDGRVLRISRDGEIRAAGRLGFAPDAIFVSDDEVVLSSVVEGSAVLHATDLAVIDSVEQGFLLGTDAAGNRLGVTRFNAGDDEGTVQLGPASLLVLPVQTEAQ
ncbi:TIR domain-containing protein [Microbacterium sp. PA5]|uniref:TIR domain-containing protein n=1 Tax=Microbacterium sp. PA5 TaxID=3416654 RepID=UPI003CFAC65A